MSAGSNSLNAIKINRKKVGQSEIISSTLPSQDELADDTVLLKLDIFGLSTNNITYAVLGDTMGYWNFFPKGEGFSQLPVWGFGEVTASKHAAFEVGDRYYGYFPMASHVVVHPDKVNAFGFDDKNPSRNGMHPLYDKYINTKNDSSYRKEDEPMQVLYRPLFYTSFLINDFLIENNDFDAERIIVTSASSKTAYGFAAILHHRKQQGATYEIHGQTSARNVDFVKSLGIYDSVSTYDDVADLNSGQRTVIVDHTGNQNMLHDMGDVLGDTHAETVLIGAVQNDKLEQSERGKHGQFFFAPVQAHKCFERWGPEGFANEYAKEWNIFLEKLNDWVDVHNITGTEEMQAMYLRLLDGSPSPRTGIVARFS